MAEQPRNIMQQLGALLGFGQPAADPNAGLSDFERLQLGLNPAAPPPAPSVQDMFSPPAAKPNDLEVLRALGSLGGR